MSNQNQSQKINRRDFLKLGGGFAAALAGGSLLRNVLKPAVVAAQAPITSWAPGVNYALAATDGWAYLPSTAPAVPFGSATPYWPDDLAPAPFNVYTFGFRDVTSLHEAGQQNLIFAQKEKAQIAAPLLVMDEGYETRLTLYNLGLALRPDLIDAHTVHFHGFKNAIPMYDGEPASSVAVPIGRNLTYVYRPRDPGMYMYHCHFEDTEHVHMGMTGPVFIRPLQNLGTGSLPAGKYAYNDGDGSTAYDREFVVMLTEVWAYAHWCDSHIQLPEWTDYIPDFNLINGRCYPDTLVGAGEGIDPGTGDLLPPTGHPELQYQPVSSVFMCELGEKVLLRFANLGYSFQSMSVSGLRLRVIAKDATLLRGLTSTGRDGADLSFETNTISIGPGESVEAIFTAPTTPGTYLLYNRNLGHQSNAGGPNYGGQMAQIVVLPTGTLAEQVQPHTNPLVA